MGSTSWSDKDYADRKFMRSSTGKATFAYNADIRAGKAAAKVHDALDPSKLKAGRRESRDSADHPESNAVFVGFDVTGSMGTVPQIVQKKLCGLMGLLLRNSYLTDPAICVAGIGDATCDHAPFQLGQFESGIEIENDLTNLFLEGGGGGQQTESYELALYFLARKTACDCYEKRGKKGYAFIVGDEMAYDRVKRSEVQKIFGDDIQADIPLKDIVSEARERWELYYILPKMTSYYDDPKIIGFWRNLLGQYAMKLDDPEGISEMLAATIGVAEESVDLDGISKDLVDAGAESGVVDSVTKALVPIGEGKLSTKGTGLAEL
jgi:hypothetical protein